MTDCLVNISCAGSAESHGGIDIFASSHETVAGALAAAR